MKLRTFNLLAGTSLLALASAASAQTAPAGAAPKDELEEILSLEEIVVTARRKDESLQDVPTVINAVTGEDIQKLNLRDFKDIANVVPGLSMATNGNGIGATASVRGVNYDVNASGNNGTIEFYLNDAPISAGNLFQTMYDVQQVELLRGPQGTLRGRASPSGSMTVITRRPDLQEMGGYVSGTGNNIGGYNGQGAFNYPVIANMLAIRVAGAYEKNENNRVHSVNNTLDPYAKTKSGRLTVRFEPTDTLSFILTAQKTKQNAEYFDLMESQQVVYPNNPVINQAGAPPPPFGAATTVPPYLTALSRMTITDTPRNIDLDFNNYNLQAQWAFAGQKLNFVGARNEQKLKSFQPGDLGDFFGPTANPVYQGFGQPTDSKANATAYELRLSNEERFMGLFDYILGAFYQKLNTPTDLQSQTPVTASANPGPPPAGQYINATDIQRRGGNEEKSAFVNLTAHLTEALEVSGGARYIKYESQGDLYQKNTAGVYVRNMDAIEDEDRSATIYTVSAKYNFTEDFMAYVSTGTSWRPAISAVGDFSLDRSDLENTFLKLEPEESTSYEIGFKSTMLDKRIRTNVALYHQKFDNYPYRSTGGVWFIETFFNQQANANALRPSIFNFVAAVPVEVNGVEAQVDFQATPAWDMGLSLAVSKGEIKDGLIPCTDVNNDGVPDAPGPGPSLAQLQAIYGTAATPIGTAPTQGDLGTISGCKVTQSSTSAPQWSTTLQSEYRLPINSTLSSFVRGQAKINGNSGNDPLNPVDNVDDYMLLNMYLGVRDPQGVWEVALYGKNVTNTERVLSRAGSVATTRQNSGNQSTNFLGSDNTAGMTLTAPREFGVTLRYAFGSR